MNPSFRCPSCGARFRVEEKFLGRTVRCPGPECRKPMTLTAELAERTIVSPKNAASASVTQPSVKPSIKQSKVTAPAPAVSKEPRALAAQLPLRNQESKIVAGSNAPSKPAAGAAGRSKARSQRAGGSRSTGSTRYSGKNHFKPLLTGFLLTLLIGGLGIAAYSQWNSSADGAVGEIADTSSTTTGTDNAVSDATAVTELVSDQSSQPAAVANISDMGAAQLTFAVPGAALRKDAERQKALEEKLLPFLKAHCSDCHNADEQEGGVAVHDLSTVDQLLKDRRKWEKVYRMINAGAMPPSTYDPKPEEPVRKEVAELLYGELFDFDCTQVRHAGRSTIHRLNRAEYNNTIRDLFGIAMTPADEFPQDDVGEGFDNIGDVLSIPPLLMEKYLNAAETIAGAVIDTRDFSKGMTHKFGSEQFKASLNGSTNGEGFYILHTNGNVSVPFETPADGKYRIRVEAAQSEAGPDHSKVAIQVDGESVHEFEVKGHFKPSWHEHDVTLKAGSHTIAAAFLNDFYDEKAPEKQRDRNLGVRAIEVIGPEGGSTPQWHETHRRFVTATPSETVSIIEAASTVLRPILYRGFRRPVTDAEVARFASLVDQTVTQHKETYEYGLFVALQAMLVSPDFLFRKEADPEGDATERNLNDYEVATRLSYFLWSSMPDDQLLQLAENKRLLDRSILRQQIERMLRDEKALALGQNFASQWLNLRNLADVRPNPEIFPEFDDSLRSAMGQETILLFNTIVREDRSVDEFLAADYSFINERLAKHYGIAGVTGEQFVRVSLQGTNRTGVLTHASILTLTSNPGRTSPVKRGKWIMENILGDAPPPAPPGVPPLEETAKDVTGLSLRERLELHRKDPGCASCHKAMDPLGMGLENFDAVGRWREKDGEKPVDPSGDLPSGEKFAGPSELISIIRGRQEKFSRTIVERLMVYALGRGLEYYDKCAVDQTMDLMKQRGNRFSALVEGIVTSDPFMKKSRTRESTVSTTPAN